LVSNKILNIAIIGAGLIGKKRAQAFKEIRGVRFSGAYDIDKTRMKALVLEFGGKAYKSWGKTVSDKQVDAVVVATSHGWLSPIALEAVKNKKHVLIEKPGAIRAKELKVVLAVARKNHVAARVGYNHRFHPAVTKAHSLLKQGAVGTLLYARGVYGHGGRKGYDKEWRADPKRSGGGELMDQGSHLIDLFQYFFSEPQLKFARLKTYFWKMPVEDNAFMVLENNVGQLGFLHASWTQWKNIFSFEIFGTRGAVVIRGLGGSYGPESLTLYVRPSEGGVPREKFWSWEGTDESFLLETREFLRTVRNTADRYRGIKDAIRNLEIIGSAYRMK